MGGGARGGGGAASVQGGGVQGDALQAPGRGRDHLKPPAPRARAHRAPPAPVALGPNAPSAVALVALEALLRAGGWHRSGRGWVSAAAWGRAARLLPWGSGLAPPSPRRAHPPPPAPLLRLTPVG
jgi:hypothetical protein